MTPTERIAQLLESFTPHFLTHSMNEALHTFSTQILIALTQPPPLQRTHTLTLKQCISTCTHQLTNSEYTALPDPYLWRGLARLKLGDPNSEDDLNTASTIYEYWKADDEAQKQGDDALRTKLETNFNTAMKTWKPDY